MSDGLAALRRLSRPPAPRERPDPPPEVCELCGVEIGPSHGHVADLESQRLMCACRPCHLLFTGTGAGAGRFRALPQAIRRVEGITVSEAEWDDLQIPVDLVFVFRQGAAPHHSACYPGPGGATESLLDLSSWDAVLQANPVLRSVEPDVEAVLLRRGDAGVECYLVPIDTCYALVGLVRRDWVGLSGGREVWQGIEAFFADLRARSRTVARDGQAAVHG
jgi:uncharacterized protein DUF5947